MELLQRSASVTTPHKCHYCTAKAGHALVWAEGRAYIPVCARHELNGLHAIEEEGSELVRRDTLPRHKAADVSGVMVALYVPPDLAEQAAVPDGEPANRLHITLCYLGSSDEVTATAEDITSLLTPIVDATDPLELTIIGTGRFAPKMDDGEEADDDTEYPFILLVEPTDELCALRCAITDALEAAGIDYHTDYAFEPHITLDYVGLKDDDPARVARALTYTQDVITVSFGDTDFASRPMGTGGTTDKPPGKQTEPDADTTKVTYGVDMALNAGVNEPFLKANDELRYTLAPVYLPDTEDAHGEYVGADVLQKAFWGYLENSREIHLQHTDKRAGALVECVTWPTAYETTLTVPGEAPKPITFPAGTVYAGIVWEPAVWALIKAGKLRGLSMGGRAKKVYADVEGA